MKKFLLSGLLLLPGFLFSQDFRNIITAGQTFYTDSTGNPGYLAGVQTDSILSQGNGDTIFLAANTIRSFPGTPLPDILGGILGRRFYKHHDGWF
jgi:hypothetical protein